MQEETGTGAHFGVPAAPVLVNLDDAFETPSSGQVVPALRCVDGHNHPIDPNHDQAAPRLDPRVLEVYAKKPGQGYATGTGYLLEGGMVLTSAHVVSGTPVFVRRPGDSHLECAVVWHPDHEPSADRPDAALLRITDPRWVEPASLPPLHWGALVTEAAIPVALVCFPTSMEVAADEHSSWYRDSAHLSGVVDRRLMRVTPTHPLPSRAGRLRWKGASGAAVLAAGTVIGVVAKAQDEPGAGWLTIVPITDLLAHPGFRELVGPIEVVPAELRHVLTAAAPRRAYSPVSLLSADVEAVPFYGRSELVTELLYWCANDQAFDVRLVTAPGGHGKTRLARRLVTVARERGWHTGFLRDRVDAAELSVLGALTEPLLLVIDYAEDRGEQLTVLLDELRAVTARPSPPKIRLLLLARSAGEWWTRLLEQDPLAPIEVSSPVRLPGLDPTAAARRAAVENAMTHLAARLDEIEWDGPLNLAAAADAVLPDVSAERFACALNLQMAALVAVLQAVDPVPSGTEHETVLLRHEQKYWKRTAVRHGLDLPLASRRRLVGIATLCQAEDQRAAHDLLTRYADLRAGVDDRRDGVARWLASLYPADGMYWGSLQPDRLGEYLAATVITEDPLLPHDVLPGTTRRQGVRALRTLARADLHRPGMASVVHDVITAHPVALAPAAVEAATTVENPDPLRRALSAVTADPRTDPAILGKLYDEVPLQTQALGRWATDLAARLAEAAGTLAQSSASPAVWAEQAKRLNNLSIRLSAAGMHSQAVEAAKGSVALRQRLTDDDATADLFALNLSLNTYANCLSDNGRFDKALEVAEEVVRLSKLTADVDPGGSAHALYNLASRLADVGRNAEAKDTAKVALDEFRRLAIADPVRYGADEAMALNAYSQRLGDLGEFELALRFSTDAVALYRPLTAQLPDEYTEDLAGALGTRADLMAALGRMEEAALVVAESVGLFRTLAHPDVQGFVNALNTNAECLADLGMPEEAAEVLAEALALLEPHRESESHTFALLHARALANRANALLEIGLLDEAASHYEKAVTAYRRLTFGNADERDGELGEVLVYLATCHAQRNHAGKALAAATEAADFLARLGDGALGDHRRDLLDSLRLRTLLLSEAGRRAEAVLSADEYVSAGREADRVDHVEFGLAVADSLVVSAIALSELQRNPEMLAAAVEGHSRWLALFEQAPDEHRAEFVRSAHVLAAALSEAGQGPEALSVVEGCARLLGADLRHYPSVSIDRAETLLNVGRAAEANALARRMLRLDWDERESDRSDLLVIRARALSALGRPRAALKCIDLALTIRERLAEDEPVRFLVEVGMAWLTRARILAAGSDRVGAAESATRAVTAFNQIAESEPAAFPDLLGEARALLAEVTSG
ncbi:hypothetical protein [Actinokineospora fastidiosa]|uniref:hypothetical protein n=1 Tax=Actinokineospora fastidiosa TaxID=1816 RepID=UPI00166F96F2|nr:hypothetical protein [Actinokineospora fastidiosa]